MIRLATEGDLEAIGALERACFGRDTWSLELIRDDLRAPHRHLTVAEHQRRILGYLAFSVVGDAADLERVAVDPHERQQGVAMNLLQQAIAAATARGAHRMLLEVQERNAPALALYAGAGFVQIGRRLDYPRRGVTSLVLQRDLI